MGAQLGKQRVKSSDRKAQSVLIRLQKLRKNKTTPLFSTTSMVSLDKCDSLIDIHGYEFKSPSYLNLYQTADKAEAEDRPEDWIRSYKDLKNKVHACNGSQLEWRSVKLELEAFVQGLDECNVWELRSTLLEKLHRLGAQLEEKRCSDEDHKIYDNRVVFEKDESGDNHNEAGGNRSTECEDNIPPENIQEVQTYETFIGLSTRIDAVRYRMILYYGDDKQSEYCDIQHELQEIVLELRSVKDRGVLSVIVTREEYEDYVNVLKQRFQRLVQLNMRQKKTSINPGTANTTASAARLRRSNINVSAVNN